MIDGLSTGQYRVHSYPVENQNWLDEFSDNTRDWGLATPVDVALSDDTAWCLLCPFNTKKKASPSWEEGTQMAMGKNVLFGP